MSSRNWEVFKRQIAIQLDEYEHAVGDAAEWWAQWKERNRGFRCKRILEEIGNASNKRN